VVAARHRRRCGIFLLGPSPDTLASGTAFTQEVFFDCGDARS
jgi:hypothetical protein